MIGAACVIHNEPTGAMIGKTWLTCSPIYPGNERAFYVLVLLKSHEVGKGIIFQGKSKGNGNSCSVEMKSHCHNEL